MFRCRQFKDAIEEIASGSGLKTASPNLHINVLYENEHGDRIVVEIQIFFEQILEMKKDSHMLYEIVRAGSVDQLRAG